MILRGWKDICKAAGGMSVDTARKLARDDGLPVEFIGGRPMSTSEDLEKWVSARISENAVKNKIGRSEPIEAYQER